jgi:nicotinamidase-related amidase
MQSHFFSRGQIMAETALLIIDVQRAIDDPKWGARNNPGAEANMSKLLSYWRTCGMPVIHIRHDSVEAGSPYRPGQPGHAFKEAVMPFEREKVIGKNTNNAFVGTGLHDYLFDQDIDALVICGVLTQHSVDTTARMAASLGYRVLVVSDATAATGVTDGRSHVWAADDVHALALAHLEADYATIAATADILAGYEI